jgi:hypothetical protein
MRRNGKGLGGGLLARRTGGGLSLNLGGLGSLSMAQLTGKGKGKGTRLGEWAAVLPT